MKYCAEKDQIKERQMIFICKKTNIEIRTL